jgi:hypothetical protein
MANLYSGLLGFSLITQFFTAIPFILIILPLTYFMKVRLYSLTRKEDCIKLQASLQNWTNTMMDGKGYGYSLGWNHYVHLSITTSSDWNVAYSAWLLCTEDTFNFVMKDTESENTMGDCELPPPIPTYKILHKSSGNFANTYYIKDKGEVEYDPREEQMAIVQKIEERFRERGRAVAFIHGPPNSGKSMVGVFLASRLGGFYCNEFTPWNPGDSLSILKQEHKPTRDCPLIVAMDEIDDAVIKISNGLIKENETTMISTATKNAWNTLFDNLDRGMYPNTILILTSNLSTQEIAQQCKGGDTSLLRDKRVSDFFHLEPKQLSCK